MGKKLMFHRLFQSGQIGKMSIRNRIVMPAMATVACATDDGFATELSCDLYEARAKGGAGLVIVGSTCVDWPAGISGMPRLTIHDDKFIPGLSQVVQVIHKHGAAAAVQLIHAGPSALERISHVRPVAASAIARPTDYVVLTYDAPRELSVSEIGEIVARFAKAAERAQKAGFDGIEIHAGHRYLINSFLSPYWNKRQDKYGGDLRNRARFLLEIISATREVVGRSYPFWCRINGEERDVKGGITLELAKQLAPMLQDAGLSAIHVSLWPNRAVDYGLGFAADLAAEIKKVVSIPVIAVGRISLELGEKLLRQKKADFIAMGRGLLADPELPSKAASGRLNDITPCLYCNFCLSPEDEPANCTVNAAVRKEREYAIRPAEKTKKVLVVGSGPGGMEAARVAALRGHRVVLYEKEHRLGGQLILASMLRKEDEALTKYLSTQIKKLEVKVKLGKEVTPALIAEIRPNTIVLAAGATSILPEITGIDRGNVLSGKDIQEMMNGHLRRGGRGVSWQRVFLYLGCVLMRAPVGQSVVRWLLGFWIPLGREVVVVGRRLPGIELADFLVQRGKKVTIVDTREDLPIAEPPMSVLRRFLESRLVKNGIQILSAARYDAVTDEGLGIINKKGEPQVIKGDTIVFAADYKPNAELSAALAGMPYEVHLVGDCVKPCGIREAILDGSRIGRAI